MYSNEKEIIYKYMDKASIFFEFGSGSSTHQAMKRGLTTYTVESSPAYHDLIKHDFQIIDIPRYYLKNFPNKVPNITYITYDLQLNFERNKTDFINYARTYNHSKYHADLIYIHGNCRDAAALNVFNEIDDKTIVIFQAPHELVLNFSSQIATLCKYYDLIEQSSTLYVFKKSDPSKQIDKNDINEIEQNSYVYYDSISPQLESHMNSLLRSYYGLIRSYAYNYTIKAIKPKKHYVWTMWASGEKNAPFLSAHCFRSMKKYLPNQTLIILDLNDTSYYSGMPSYIFEKLYAKKITITHFTDILRSYLIAKYGGIWLDSTIYLTGKLNSNWFNYQFYAPKFMQTFFAGNGRWAIWAQAGFQNSIPQSFCRDLLFAYWANHYKLSSYFLIDIIYCIGYRYIPTIHRLIDNVPETTRIPYTMIDYLNTPYTQEIMNHILSNGPMFKLSNKIHYRRFKKGKRTVFDHLFPEQE